MRRIELDRFSGLARLVSTPRRVALVALAYGLVLAVVFAVAGGMSRLVYAGEPLTSRAEAPSWLFVGDDSQSYDGQFFLRLTLSPFSRDERVEGISLDPGAYRAGRIGYPLVAKVVSLGIPRLAPFALLATNVIAMAGLGLVAAALAVSRGRPAALGLAVVLYPGFVLSIGRDLSEIVALTFALGGLWLWGRHRFTFAAAAFTAACLTRETTTLVVAAALIAALVTNRRGTEPERVRGGLVVAPGVALAVMAGWQVLLRVWWGQFSFRSGASGNVSWPLGGLLTRLGRFFPPTNAETIFRTVALVVLLAAVVLGLTALRDAERPWDAVHIAFALAVVQFLILGPTVMEAPSGFLRASTEMFTFAVIVLWSMIPRTASAVRSWALAGFAALTLLATVLTVAKELSILA